MDLQIFTRTRSPILYAMSSEFLPQNIERIKCDTFNEWTDARVYLHHILHSGKEWIINLDEDAFITDWDAVMQIVDYMNKNGYEYAGMPDGGVCHHRSHSWVVCNPFFNVFNTRAIRNKMPDTETIDNFLYDPEVEKFKPDFVTGPSDNNYIEPFNNLFYWLSTCSKGLYLNADMHTDNVSTVLKWDEQPFLYHSWYAREFDTNPDEHERITRLYEEAKGLYAVNI